MGAAAGTIQEVEVAYTKSHYPAPAPPKFNFKELYKNIPLHNQKDLADEGFDWLALEFALKSEEYEKSEQKGHGKDGEIKAVFEANKIAEHSSWKNDKRIKQRNVKPEKQRDDNPSEPTRLIAEAGGIPMVFNSRRRVDQHAREAHPELTKTFNSLFTYLNEPIKQGFYPQTFLVRAIMVWLAYQNIERGKYGPPSLGSPAGILAHLQLQSLSYAKALTLLCRAAGIPCVLIDGFVKAGNYEPGDMLDDTAEDTWCAVYVDDSWQIVHPLWICRGSYGLRKPGFVHIDTRDILPTVPTNTASKPKSKRGVVFNEDFFMPPPEEYVQKCYATQTEWQLLQEWKIVKTLDAFMEFPYVTSTFMKLGLSFNDKPKNTVHAEHGNIRLVIAAPADIASRLMFQSILSPLSLNTEGSTNITVSTTNYSKLVLSFRSNERFIFDIRLPFEGTYKFEILGGVERLYSLSRFLIVCTEPMIPCIPLPVDTMKLGWGQGPIAEKHGLILPSNPNGFISILPTEGNRIIQPSYAKPENIVNISFQLGRRAMSKYDYSADLRASYSLAATNTLLTKDMKRDTKQAYTTKASQNLSLCVEGKRDLANRLLKFRITVPKEGEYALVIMATEYIVKKERKHYLNNTTRPICFYLLSAKDDWAKQYAPVKLARRELHRAMAEAKLDWLLKAIAKCKGANVSAKYTPEKLARRELHSAMAEANIDRLQKAIAKCKGAKIPVVDNAVAAAELRVEHMKLQRDLEDCVKRRNTVIINATLRKVLKYRYRSAFVEDVEVLLQFKNELLKLRGYPRGIYSLREANEEMMKVARPLPEVHNTMRALLLMLGYYGNMDDWLIIQSTIKVAPDTLDFKNILKQMEELDDPSFPWKHVNMRHVEKVAKVLHKHTYVRVFRANQAAALFYEWVERCLTRAPSKKKTEENGKHASRPEERHRRRRHRWGRRH